MRKKFWDSLTDQERLQLFTDWDFLARDEQRPPPESGWTNWLFMGGRGSGKTRAGAEWIAQGIRSSKMNRVALIGATHHDARSIMIEGPAGLLSVSEGAYYEPSLRRVTWPDGQVATVLSADEPDSIRGHQFDAAWADELGCPAVDKGANQPNVFVDPKSSESFLPYYSDGGRDDLIQRRFLEAHLSFWTNNANNPASTVYSGRMVDTANTRVWCWDARPYPAFPARSDVWGDAGNYTLGHWLNGRLGAVQLVDLVAALCEDANFTDYDVSDLTGIVTGFAVTETMSPRDAITPLSVAYHFDAVESEGVVKFRMRGQPSATALSESDLVLPDGDASFGFAFNRAQETDLPL
ncbi:MAG TPA: glycoside hydrolase TIM-barrel-like domain-containing protein, partial [Rhizomicrobium sp.]